jgi:hypothetical protein
MNKIIKMTKEEKLKQLALPLMKFLDENYHYLNANYS